MGRPETGDLTKSWVKSDPLSSNCIAAHFAASQANSSGARCEVLHHYHRRNVIKPSGAPEQRYIKVPCFPRTSLAAASHALSAKGVWKGGQIQLREERKAKIDTTCYGPTNLQASVSEPRAHLTPLLLRSRRSPASCSSCFASSTRASPSAPPTAAQWRAQ